MGNKASRKAKKDKVEHKTEEKLEPLQTAEKQKGKDHNIESQIQKRDELDTKPTARKEVDHLRMENETNDKLDYKKIMRQEVDFLGYHEFTMDQMSATKYGLIQYDIPESICDFIIELLKASNCRAYCKILLSFRPDKNNSDLFHDFRKFTCDFKRFTMYSYSMGNFIVLPVLPGIFRRGSGWGLEWGMSREWYINEFVFHQYENPAIYKSKSFDPRKEEIKTDKGFFACQQMIRDGCHSELLKGNNDRMGQFRLSGGIAVLCLNYKQQNSLEIAYEFAEKSKISFKMTAFVVVDCDDDGDGKTYFEWKDVKELGDKYNASCFEIAKEVDDNTIFVYNQIIIEYCLRNKKGN